MILPSIQDWAPAFQDKKWCEEDMSVHQIPPANLSTVTYYFEHDCTFFSVKFKTVFRTVGSIRKIDKRFNNIVVYTGLRCSYYNA